MEFVITDHSDEGSLDYNIELGDTLTYLYANFNFQGDFGTCVLKMTRIEECVIWICECVLEKSINIKTINSQKVWQIHFPSTEFLFDKANNFQNNHLLFSDTPEVLLSLEESPVLQLTKGEIKTVYLHYLYNSHLLQTEKLVKLIEKLTLSEKGEAANIKMQVNDPITSAIFDITTCVLDVPHRLLYIEAKSMELFVLTMALAEKYEADTGLISKPEIEKLIIVKNTLLNNLENHYSIFELAKIIGMNAFTLKQLFKELYGKNIHDFVKQARMEKAKILLQTSDLSVKDIATEMGYKNLSNFSESFKIYYGYPPTQLRRKQ